MALLPLGLVACGSDDDSNAGSEAEAAERIRSFGSEATGQQARQAEAAVRGYLDARAAGRWRQACSYFVRPIRRLLSRVAARSDRIDGRGCAGAIAHYANAEPLPRADEANVTEVRVDDRAGYVIYEDSAGDSYAIRIIRGERRNWGPLASAATRLGAQ